MLVSALGKISASQHTINVCPYGQATYGGLMEHVYRVNLDESRVRTPIFTPGFSFAVNRNL